MITRMTRYSFILLSGEKEGFLSHLRELGLMDITRSVKPIDAKSSSMLDTATSLSALIQKLEALDIPCEGSSSVIHGEGSSFVISSEVEKSLSTAATAAFSRLSALEVSLAAAEKDAAAKRPWGDFSTEKIKALEAVGFKIRYHAVTAKAFKEEWAEQYPLQKISESDGKIYFVTVSDSLVDIPEMPAPSGSFVEAEKEAETIRGEIAAVQRELAAIKKHLPEIRAEYDKALSDLDLYLAGEASVSAAEDTIVTFEGFAPTESDGAVTSFLEECGVFYLKEAARVEENPPIKFKNNRFVRMFEVLTDMYGRPSYDGFDPTPFISIFFLLFFAFCMGDAGYGLILILVGFALKKVESFKSLAPLVVTLGIGTTLVGFFFHTFFSMNIANWSIFAPVKWMFLPDHLFGLSSFDAAMVLAILIGVFHICLAMIVKTVAATRAKGFLESLGTWGWTLLIVGGVIVGGIALTGVISSEVTKWVIIVLGVLSALGIFLFNNIHRNPLVNIGSGLWETYNTVTGLLGDVLSYLRLYALGLAGAKLGEAFNAIGTMVLGDGSSVVPWVAFILIVIVGHTLNLAMCALGAFVHPLRLNFLEFFKNSGYEASGRSFNPLKYNNK
ncbi:MAG: ATPase V [Bacteroidales bacterium]|nr:ATPase V [Bacteroidales bacterium]